MKKHIKLGIRLAGLKPAAVKIHETKHCRLTLPNGKKVTVSGTPRNHDTAALRIAADIRSAMGVAE